MKLSNTYFGLIFIFFLLSNADSFSQVGIATTTPDESSILEIYSTDKGLLIPRIPLTSTTDVTTIYNFGASGKESLLVYNTQTIADITPGYYYWQNNKWNRLLISSDLPPLVVSTLLDNGNGTYTYTNEIGVQTVIDMDSVVDYFETLTSINFNPTTSILSYVDENSITTNLDLNLLKIEPWYVQNTTNKATLNTDNIFQNGNVAIKKNVSISGVSLDVSGSIRGGNPGTGSVGINTLGVGDNVTASAENSVVFGQNNSVNFRRSGIIGGSGGIIDAQNSGIVGGFNNRINTSAESSFIGGGTNNNIFASSSSIIGATASSISNGGFSIVLGGMSNAITSNGNTATLGGTNNQILGGAQSVIIGGSVNRLQSSDAVLMGGFSNRILAGSDSSGLYSGSSNTITGARSTILGGRSLTIAQGEKSSLIAGESNTMNATNSIILGGSGNTVNLGADNSGIFGGNGAIVNGLRSVILGGNRNRTLQDNCLVGGAYNTANSANETVFGMSATNYTPTNTLTDRLFTIGKGNATGSSRSDGFTILKNGEVGIGYNNFQNNTIDAILQVNGKVLIADLPVGANSDQFVVADALGNLKKVIKTDSSIKTVAANYTALNIDETILVNANSASRTVTLPISNQGKKYTIKKVDASVNTVTLNSSMGNIDGSASFILNSQWKYVTVQFDGANWFVIGNN